MVTLLSEYKSLFTGSFLHDAIAKGIASQINFFMINNFSAKSLLFK
jgi:hypothetical protein